MITTTRGVTPHFSGVHRGKAPAGDASKRNFYYSMPADKAHVPYWSYGAFHTSGEDTVILKAHEDADRAERAELNRGRWDRIENTGPAAQALHVLPVVLVNKEPNHQFQLALVAKHVSAVLALLKNPEVKLSESDTPGSMNLAERLLGNDENFSRFAETLYYVDRDTPTYKGKCKGMELDKDHELAVSFKIAVSFIRELLVKQIKSDLTEVFQLEVTKEQIVKKRNHLVPTRFTDQRDDRDLEKFALKLAKEAVEEYQPMLEKMKEQKMKQLEEL